MRYDKYYFSKHSAAFKHKQGILVKSVGLDIGDVWTGIAVSDALQLFARPHTTVSTADLILFLTDFFTKEQIAAVVVGYPKTMRGTESEQTKSVNQLFEHLKMIFPQVTWVLWDERLSSRRADTLKKAHTKSDKTASHALAAAFILGSYLDYQAFQRDI